jgi:hypothetical protein
LQPIGPTRHYMIVCDDGRRIDIDAEAMWPTGSRQEFWGTLDVIGPRQVCVRRIAASDVRQVEREDGAIWATGVRAGREPLAPGVIPRRFRLRL